MHEIHKHWIGAKLRDCIWDELWTTDSWCGLHSL